MTGLEPVGPPRWHNYVMESGPRLKTFWETHLRDTRHVLFLLGKGFDPRICLSLRSLLNAGGTGKRDVIAIEFDEGASSPSRAYQPLVEANWTMLQSLVVGKGDLSIRPLKMWSDDGRRIGSRSAAGLFGSLHDFHGYTDIVVDISALPRGIYFPLISKILYLLDQGSADGGDKTPDFHVMVAEDPMLDRRIQDEGVDEIATYVHPFGGGLEMEATADHPKVWIPVLGERQATQLGRIYDLVMPNEIAPLLPSPSVNPRRSDDLLLEYRELLFDRFESNRPTSYSPLSGIRSKCTDKSGRPFSTTVMHFSHLAAARRPFRRSCYPSVHCSWLTSSSKRKWTSGSLTSSARDTLWRLLLRRLAQN